MFSFGSPPKSCSYVLESVSTGVLRSQKKMLLASHWVAPSRRVVTGMTSAP